MARGRKKAPSTKRLENRQSDMVASFIINNGNLVQHGGINVVQELIYFFNEPAVRNYLVDHYTRLYPDTPCQHAGTFFLRKSDDDAMVLELDADHHRNYGGMQFKKALERLKSFLKARGKITLFTLAILYNTSSIHFVSCMYDEGRRKLVCFDPGFNLYQNGSRVLIPVCIDNFIQLRLIDNEDDTVVIGKCHRLWYGRRFGVQYNGDDPDAVSLAADSFCQSWSLFFIIMCIVFKGDYNFVWLWCKIPPTKREQFILERFFFPHLLSHAPILRRFRAKFPPEHMRALEDLYARTMMTHWVGSESIINNQQFL